MRKVAFLVPASPTRGFLCQIAALDLALRKLDWSRWEPSVFAFLGGEPDFEAIRAVGPFLRNASLIFVPAVQFAQQGIWAQADSVFRVMPRDVDVYVAMDADTLAVGGFEGVLDRVADRTEVAGTMAHVPFPFPGSTPREAWEQTCAGLIRKPLRFEYAYSLTAVKDRPADWQSPFYPNFGAVFFPGAVFADFSTTYLALREKIAARLPEPFYSGQVAVALALAEIGARTWALPMRYNFPNDPEAARRYPVELEHAAIFHYLRTEAFDRARIFAEPSQYRAFLDAPLNGVNRVFQQAVARIFGPAYPFPDATSEIPRAFSSDTPPAHRKEVACPLSPAIYRDALAKYDAQVGSVIENLDKIIAEADDTESDDGALSPTSIAHHLIAFERSGRRDPFPLMRLKQALAERFGVAEGFAFYRTVLGLPDSDRLRLAPLVGQSEFARREGETFLETDPGGERFVVYPPTVIGEGNHRPLTTTSRSSYVACLKNARVRGVSSVVDVGNAVLFDYEGDELTNFDTEFEFDTAVFRGSNEETWVIEPEQPGSIVVDTAFTLLSARNIAFGHWTWESLPKFVLADMSGMLPRIPVLIDADMPRTHRQSLELMLPQGSEIIEVPRFVTVHVNRLWCAPTVHFASIIEKRNERFAWDQMAWPLERAKSILQEMGRRADAALGDITGSERVFLARKPSSHRQLVNHQQIEAIAEAHGFVIRYPEDHDFADQVRLVRAARFVVMPQGSAVSLACFARSGMRMCILNHTITDSFALHQSMFGGIGVDLTVLTGPITREHKEWEEWADYRIDEDEFRRFLETWTLAEPQFRMGNGIKGDGERQADEALPARSPEQKDLVSIITIFLNGMEFFDEAIASVFNQTYENWEWLLVDDGSSDGSSEKAQQLAAEHPAKVRYLCHDNRQNRGMSASRNLGIANVKGEYVALLDIDDVWFPEKLAVHTEIMRLHPGIAMVYGPLYFWYNWPGNKAQKQQEFICRLGDEHNVVIEPPAAVFRQIRISDGFPAPSSVTLRAAAVRAVGGWEDAFTGTYDCLYEDEVFFSKICLRYPVYLMAQHYDLYRQHDNSFSAAAVRSGDYIMGAAVPSRARHKFLKWLQSYASASGQQEVAKLVQSELVAKYAQFEST